MEILFWPDLTSQQRSQPASFLLLRTVLYQDLQTGFNRTALSFTLTSHCSLHWLLKFQLCHCQGQIYWLHGLPISYVLLCTVIYQNRERMSEVRSILPSEYFWDICYFHRVILMSSFMLPPNKPRKNSKIIDSGVWMIQNIYVLSWAAKIVV